MVIFVCAAAFLILVAIGGLFLKAKISIEKKEEFKIDSTILLQQFSDLKTWNEWNPWSLKDSSMEIKYLEDKEGNTIGYSWSGDKKKVGKGQVEVSLIANDTIEIVMKWAKMKPFKHTIQVESKENTCILTWNFEIDLSGVITDRYHGLFLEKWIDHDLSKGIDTLKIRLEK